MGVIIAIWLSRLEAALLLALVKVTGWLTSVLVQQSSTPADLYQDGKPVPSEHHRHPSHPGPGLWYLLPRAALIGWLIAVVAAAAHRGHGHSLLQGHQPVDGMRRP